MEYIQDCENLKLIRNDSKTINLLGIYKSQNILIKMETKNGDINKIENLTEIMDNDRFKKYIGKVFVDCEVIIIYPALKEDLTPILKDTLVRNVETYEDYKKNIIPIINKQDLSWMYNIIDGKTEQEKVLFHNDNFIFLPDYKWDQKNMKNLHCLAIVKNRDIRSLRDLTYKHIYLLENVYKNGIETVKKIYGLNENQLNIYVHYHPSFWHLHIHFSNIEYKNPTIMNHSHSIKTIINNMKIIPNYYQLIELEVYNHQ